MSDSLASAERLNRDCDCVGTDVPALQSALDSQFAASRGGATLPETHPHLFSAAPVFVGSEHMRQVERIIEAIGVVVANPIYRQGALARAPAIAHAAKAARGVFFGYDFHITPGGPKLIEINTNAGGALLNIELLRAQQACCPPVEDYLRAAQAPERTAAAILDMFAAEWRLARGAQPLKTVAIVDDDPASQYLFPEFLLFQRLLAQHGIDTLIADARELELLDGALSFGGRRIDLVYNRTTDFYFAADSHRALRAAYDTDAAVITPHPHAHALYSHKANLTTLTDSAVLRSMGIPPDVMATLLEGIPRTVPVEGSADAWWRDRARWFFKPAQGFGSRGTYRGDKLTRRVFEEIMAGGYVAQEFAAPAERLRSAESGQACYKFDLRSYVYDGKQQLLAARLYQGQTTNFRSPGGGFAPVYLLSDPVPGTEGATGGLNATGLCLPS
jgi:hypothetical protein